MIIINYLLAIFLDDQLNILPISSHVKTLEKAPPGKPIFETDFSHILNQLHYQILLPPVPSHLKHGPVTSFLLIFLFLACFSIHQ